MFKHVILRLPIRPSPYHFKWPHIIRAIRQYAARRGPVEATEEDLATARKWLANLNAETIPRSIGEVTFSRSSGPGGQNVNK